ncbi:unnamed protein product [Parajaminaea phylloscopi]
MTLLSQPWSGDESGRVVAAASHLSYGVGQSLARTIFFLGPFTLGAITLEALSSLPVNVAAITRYAKGTDGHRRRGSIAVRIAAILAQFAAVAATVLYVAYTHGDTNVTCGAWPHVLVATSAISVTLAVAVFVAQAMQMPRRLPATVFCLLGFLALSQIVVSLAATASWHGRLRPSGAACYLRISRWYGLFSLVPLVALFVAMVTLTTGVTHDRYRYSTSSKATSRTSDRPHDLPSPTTAASKQEEGNIERLYRSARLPLPTRPDGEENVAFQESFLKLHSGSSGTPSMYTAAKANERSIQILLKYISWASFTALALLCGVVIAFLQLSPVLTFAYQPLLVVIPAISANRLCQLRLGSGARHSRPSVSSGDTTHDPSTANNSPFVRAKLALPFQLAYKTTPSRPSTAASVDQSATMGGPAVRAARFINRKISKKSLRPISAHDYASVGEQTLTQRAEEPTRVMRPVSQSLLSTLTPVENLPVDFFETLRKSDLAAAGVMGRAVTEGPGTMPKTQASRYASQFRSVDNLQNMNTSRVEPDGSLFYPLSPGPRSRKATLPRTSSKGGQRGETTTDSKVGASAEEQSDTGRVAGVRVDESTTDTRKEKQHTAPNDGTAGQSKQDGQGGGTAEGVFGLTSRDYASDALSHTIELLEGRAGSKTHSDGISPQPTVISRGSSQLDPDPAAALSRSAQSTELQVPAPAIVMTRPLSIVHDSHQHRSKVNVTEPSHSDVGHSDGEMSEQSHASHSRVRRPRRPPSIRSVGTPSIADMDEDDLKQIMDARGFAREVDRPGQLTREEKFQRALKLRVISQEVPLVIEPPVMEHSPALSGAIGTTDETEASFGLAEISHNPRLQKVEKTGNAPRRNPFASTPRPASFLNNEQRQPSDESNASKPTAITDSSGGSSGDASGNGGRGRTTDSSQSGGLDMDRHTSTARALARGQGRRGGAGGAGTAPSEGSSSGRGDGPVAGRIGIGERGALPEPPVPRLVTKKTDGRGTTASILRPSTTSTSDGLQTSSKSTRKPVPTAGAPKVKMIQRAAPSESEGGSSASGSGSAAGTFGGHQTMI